MINCIELTIFNETEDMRKLHCYHPFWSQRDFESFHEIINIWNVRQYIIPDEEVAIFAVVVSTS